MSKFSVTLDSISIICSEPEPTSEAEICDFDDRYDVIMLLPILTEHFERIYGEDNAYTVVQQVICCMDELLRI